MTKDRLGKVTERFQRPLKISQIEKNFTLLYFTCRERRSSDSVLSKLWSPFRIIVILLAWYLGSFAALFLRVHFSSAKCQSQNQCIPPPHSLVWQRNLIELETFCDTDTGHHFYCTQSPGVGSSNSTVETHLFRAYAKNTTFLLIHNIWTLDTSAKATFVWILSASRCSQLWEREETICDNPL